MKSKKSEAEKLGFRAQRGYVHADKRRRFTIAVADKDTGYRVLSNDRGQILLDPVVAIPSSEAWVLSNPALRASMERALKQAGDGEFEDLGSFKQFANDDE